MSRPGNGPDTVLPGVQTESKDNSCIFRLPGLASNETGDWQVTMEGLHDERDSASLEVVVGRAALASLVVEGGASTNSSLVQVARDTELEVVCGAGLGRPDTQLFQWQLSQEDSWNQTLGQVDFSSRDQYDFRNSSQHMLLSCSTLGTYTLTCSPSQVIRPSSKIL